MWIAHTQVLESSIVDSLTLCFMLALSVTLHTTFVSPCARGLQQSLEPLTGASLKDKFPVVFYSLPIIAFAIVVAMGFSIVLPDVEEITQVQKHLCGGNVSPHLMTG